MRSGFRGRAPVAGRIWCALAMAVLASSCQTSAAEVLPPSTPVVEVAMREYRFDYDTAIPSGRVVFRAVNTGSLLHRVVVFPMPDDLPPIDELLRGSGQRIMVPLAGIPPQVPGASGTFALDLTPGRYAMICTMVSRAGNETHAVKGMASEFRVQGQ